MTDGTQEVEVPDVMGMSDEEFLSQDFSEVKFDVEEAPIEQSEEAETEEDQEEATADLDEPEVSGEADSDEPVDNDTEDSGEEETSEEDEDDEDSEAADEQSSDEPEESEEAESDEEDSDEPNEYQSQIEELFAPIRANGREVKIKDIEEARKFISMGMGFNKKMEALKPARLLQQKMKEHGLLEEGKLDFLIALDKKNPEAIAQLLKDSKIDPLSIDMESESSYQPETYSGGEDNLALEDVITDLEQSEYASDIANLVANKWGESSKEILRQSPRLLSIIESHMSVGIYDSIMERVEREKMLGNFSGMSDIETYGQVAEQMNQEGQFAHLAPAKQKQHKPAPVIKKAITPKPKADPNLKRKKATAVTKSGPTPPKKAAPDYGSMSDEDFMKSLGSS